MLEIMKKSYVSGLSSCVENVIKPAIFNCPGFTSGKEKTIQSSETSSFQPSRIICRDLVTTQCSSKCECSKHEQNLSVKVKSKCEENLISRTKTMSLGQQVGKCKEKHKKVLSKSTTGSNVDPVVLTEPEMEKCCCDSSETDTNRKPVRVPKWGKVCSLDSSDKWSQIKKKFESESVSSETLVTFKIPTENLPRNSLNATKQRYSKSKLQDRSTLDARINQNGCSSENHSQEVFRGLYKSQSESGVFKTVHTPYSLPTEFVRSKSLSTRGPNKSFKNQLGDSKAALNKSSEYVQTLRATETSQTPNKISQSVDNSDVNCSYLLQCHLKNKAENTSYNGNIPGVVDSNSITEKTCPSVSGESGGCVQTQTSIINNVDTNTNSSKSVSLPFSYGFKIFQKSKVSQLKEKFDYQPTERGRKENVHKKNISQNKSAELVQINSNCRNSSKLKSSSLESTKISDNFQKDPRNILFEKDKHIVTKNFNSHMSLVQQAIMNFEENLKLLSPESERRLKQDLDHKSLNIHSLGACKVPQSTRQTDLLSLNKKLVSNSMKDEGIKTKKVGKFDAEKPLVKCENLPKSQNQIQCTGIEPVSSNTQNGDSSKSSGLKAPNGFQSAGRLSQSILQENGIQHSVLFPRNEQQKFGIGQHGSNDKTSEEQGVTVYQNGEGKKFSFTKTKVQFTDDVKKTPTPLPRKPKRTEEPVYVNSLGEDVTSNESTNSNNDDSIAPKPNLSFLWKHHNSFRKTRCSGSTCDTGTVESLQENVYEELNSWYSNNHNHQKGEPLYMDAESLGLNCSTASAGYEKSDCSSIGTPPTSGEDGWVDVSESEFADSSNLKLREKSKISLKKRLCSKNFRPSLKISTKESEDSLMWDTVDDDECGSTSTESTVSDHLYETVCYQTVLYNEVTRVHCETINSEVGIQEWSNPSTCSKTEIHSEDDHHLVRNPCSTKSNSGLFMPVNIDRKRMRKGIRSSVLQGRLSGNMQESGKLGKKQLQSISRMITLLQKKKTSQLSKNQIKEKSTFYVKSSTDNLPVKSNEISTSKSMIQNPKKRSPVNALQRPKAPPPLPPVSSLCVERSENVPSTSSTAATSLDKRGQREAQEVKDYDTLSVKEVRPKELAVSPSHMEEMEQSSTKGQNPFNEETSPLKLPCALLGKDSLLESILSSVKLDPEFRLSIVSSESSATREGYINMSDVESCPPSIRASDSQPMITEDKVMDVNVCSVRKRSGTLVSEQSYLYFTEAESQETVNSLFEEEPLYQFYQKDFQDRANCIQQCEDSDSEENIYSCLRNQSPDSEESSSSQSLIFKQSSTDLRQISLGGRRSLWCELPEVINSGLLQNILPQDLKLQEAMFEIITSEASYLKSLDVLLEHFMNCSEFNEFSPNCVLERMEREYLFSDIVPVREVSQRLLGDLEKRWSENLYISDICDILYDYASTKFSVYVKYCTNQIYQERTLKQLKKNKPEFVEILRRLEANPVCQCLDMHSFLILPMQRITRFPLLVDAIFHRLPQDSPKYELCKSTLAALNKVVAECNEGAKKIQRMEEIMLLSHQLEFRDCKAIPLISSSRWLVKKGGVTRLLFEDSAKYTFGRTARCLKISVYLFLFTDLLIITKKKSEENYTVIDYCPRNMVQVASLDQSLPSQLPFRSDVSKNLFQLIMLNNHEGKTVEMIFSCPLDSDRTRWIKAVTPPTSENPNERIYEQWDCPQVQCIEKYDAQEPDELSLEESDVVNVFRKTADGWYEGELIRDGTRGWFPSKHTLEVISSHVKARNLRQRYRLLVLTHTLVEEQRKAQLAQQKNKKS